MARPGYISNKHEIFCRFVAGGETTTRAYELAGYSPSSSNACTLASRPEIKKRIAEIKEEEYQKELRLKRDLAAVQAAGNPELVVQQAEWTFQRVMDMMAENVRLAQIANEFKAANEGLKMMGEAMQMFDKARENGNNSTAQGPIALIGKVTQILEGSNGGLLEDRQDPFAPRVPSPRNATPRNRSE